MSFKDLKLKKEVLDALEKSGYEKPTEIQEQAIPYILAKRDLLGIAQTGTGKTAAFALPIIDNLIGNRTSKDIKVLVLTPTRELAIQVRDNFRKYSINTDLKCSVIFGGVNQRSQVEVLKKGVEIIVATPGRLLDLINQKYVKLQNLDVLVLDEADVMLDMGFIHDVKKIISHIPKTKQTLLFSATLSKEIDSLVQSFLNNPVTVKVHKEQVAAPKISQKLYYVDKSNKAKLLIDLLKNEEIKSALVFSRTKHGANKLSEVLVKNGIKSDAIHGNKSQNARVLALGNFKSGISRVLVATDIAARGIDISELSHVINYEMPEQKETYVHRIGRTGRAGFSGSAISLVTIDEKHGVTEIERLINQKIEVIDHHYPMKNFELTKKEVKKPFKKKNTIEKPFSKPNTNNHYSKNRSFNRNTPRKSSYNN